MGFSEQFNVVDGRLVVLAPCKVNLSLLIGEKRADGFHELETVMAKVAWFDELLFEKGDTDGIELVCKGAHWAPDGQDNLVWRAYDMVITGLEDEEKLRQARCVKITLTKNIPAGSGLGSASSDAAAALLGMNRFFGLGLSDEKLHEMAGRLGSDVAFFLGGPLAFCWGRGEKIREIEEKYSFRLLLALPGVSVSTKGVYENFSIDKGLFERLSEKINLEIEKKDIDFVAGMCANILEECCFDLYPQLAELKRDIQSLGIGHVCLSGSGSTVYCLLGDVSDEDVKHYQVQLKENCNCESLVVYNNRW
ncbi:MAG: 4-(cytidine 5'-diphospho)-2-C-methyl-D-erythritol kinase [Planctomycetes bacterium]|nr:4-(cytidine 5'-diphospho)-2-C-methyl-D-erythritol kinase [Planctomycetota bacterium]